MYPHPAFHQELARQRQEECLHEARAERLAATASEDADPAPKLTAKRWAAGRLVAGWLARHTTLWLKPALHRAR